MMTVPGSSWAQFIDILAAICDTAAKKFSAYVRTHDISTPEAKKEAIDYAASLVERYGEAASEQACQIYDAIAAATGVTVPGAKPADGATYGEIAKKIHGMLKTSDDADFLGAGVGQLIKQSCEDTTLQNASRDGAEFAWIPSGETCGFCIMLASTGWQRVSQKTLKNGHAEHIHANCDCHYAVRFSRDTTYANYDPEKYREMYDSAKGDNWHEKLNSLNRDLYAKDPEKFRAQNREAYEREQERLKQPVVTDTPQHVENPTYGCRDVTNDWLKNAVPNSHEVTEVQSFTQDGETYSVDGVNVRMHPKPEEKRAAQILRRTLGGEICYMPTVCGKYEGVRTPDFLFRGKRLELKTPTKYTEKTIYKCIKGNREQACDFVVDITLCGMTYEEMITQVENVYRDPYTAFLQKLIIIRDDEILAIFERK